MDETNKTEIEQTVKSLRVCTDWRTDCEGCFYENSIPACREKLMRYAADLLEHLKGELEGGKPV